MQNHVMEHVWRLKHGQEGPDISLVWQIIPILISICSEGKYLFPINPNLNTRWDLRFSQCGTWSLRVRALAWGEDQKHNQEDFAFLLSRFPCRAPTLPAEGPGMYYQEKPVQGAWHSPSNTEKASPNKKTSRMEIQKGEGPNPSPTTPRYPGL